MAVKDNVRKVDSTVERKDSCMFSFEIIILVLKEHMATFLEDITPERMSPSMMSGKSPLKKMQYPSKKDDWNSFRQSIGCLK